ncbi:hypothetical protein bcere0028_8110 [Bacillus cereus AH1271]|uniref:hypothetical protein n=1 Tax=Bacillus paramobilis TaxID=2817477 RepID=UPI0001A12064|nr:hypothetical protein bcere0028_8110 [Bacillus cereus AH1271]
MNAQKSPFKLGNEAYGTVEMGKLADTQDYPYLNDDKYENIHLEVTFLNLQCRTEIHSFWLLQRNR